jgi:polyadenylate-binding protein 2
VDYEATPEELQAHFASCGTINRVTILCDKFTGKPKGHAYIEVRSQSQRVQRQTFMNSRAPLFSHRRQFNEKESIENAVLLDDSLFKGRQLKVMPKRVNLPNFKGGGKGRKGKGGRFRGGGRRGGRRGRSFNYYY